MNRFRFNFKRNVGPTSELIRLYSPKSIDEWREYHFKNVRSKNHIEDLGKKLYIKITEVVQAEVEALTEKDCGNVTRAMRKRCASRTFPHQLFFIQ